MLKAWEDRMPQPRLKVTTPVPREIWQAVAGRDPGASAFHEPEWFRAVCEAHGMIDCSRMYETLDGARYILPLVRHRGLHPTLNVAQSMPDACGPGGVVGTRPVTAEIAGAIWADLLSLRYLMVRLRPNPLQADAWEQAQPAGVRRIPRRSHILDLDQGFEVIWTQRFAAQKRTAVRKSERLNVTVDVDTTGRLVPVFYDLLTKSFDRWGHQQHEPKLLTRLRGKMRDPLKKFSTAARLLGPKMRIWVAYFEGAPAAAIITLEGINTAYARGAMDKELAAMSRANDLLQKLAIEHAANSGCRYYQMGESGWSKPLSLFKESFGARPYEYGEYIAERLPISQINYAVRTAVKRLIGFKDSG